MEIDIASPDGNVFFIIGVVCRLLRDTHREDEISAVMERMHSGDYKNALAVATEVSYGSITFCDSREDDA